MAAAYWLETYSLMNDEELRNELLSIETHIEKFQSLLVSETNREQQSEYKLQLYNLGQNLAFLKSFIEKRQQESRLQG